VDQIAAQSVVACIVNGRARSNNAISATERVAALFREHGAKVETVVVGNGRELTPTARSFAERGYRTVVAGGGDGTVSAVAAALVGTQTSLGVLPLGTLNHFAKDVGIPLDLDAAVDTIVNGEPMLVDVGEMNGRIFINNSSIGLYPAIVQERTDRQSRGYSKWLAFVHAVFSVMRRCPSFHASLHADGVFEAADRTPFIFVGNNAYETSGLRIGERGRLDGGRLWVCRAPGAGRGALIRLAARAVLGRASPGELQVLEAEELWVQSGRQHLRVANDGEVFSTTSPLHYRIRPKALRVIVPKAREAREPKARESDEPKGRGGDLPQASQSDVTAGKAQET
jgi:diacylglycerol kinase family enzyme